MKKILVPTDFSQHAEHALKVAAQIARENDGEIYLLHMLELPSHVSDGIGESNAVGTTTDVPEVMFFMEKTRERFEETLNEPYLQGINVVEAIQFDRAFEGIMKHSKKHNIDLIVMGSHGASGFREMFIGSNTEKVVRTSEVPVLVIKKEQDGFNPQKLVFASDFSDEIKKPFAKVVDFANSFNADLIGMCTHGRKGLAHFFNGSISEDLVNHAVRPVVTFKI